MGKYATSSFDCNIQNVNLCAQSDISTIYLWLLSVPFNVDSVYSPFASPDANYTFMQECSNGIVTRNTPPFTLSFSLFYYMIETYVIPLLNTWMLSVFVAPYQNSQILNIFRCSPNKQHKAVKFLWSQKELADRQAENRWRWIALETSHTHTRINKVYSVRNMNQTKRNDEAPKGNIYVWDVSEFFLCKD